jgi:hypothetical protein
MKRRIALSIALALSVLSLALVSSDSTARAQPEPREKFTADTGIVPLGHNQRLRLVINWGDGKEAITVRLRQMEYTPEACNSSGVCKLVVASQSTSAPITLMPGQAASFDIDAAPNGDLHMAVRGIILARGLTKDMTGTLQIINETTGDVTSLMALLIPE